MVASLDSELTVGVDIREWRRGTSTGIGRVLTSYLSWAAKHTAHHHVLVGNEQSEVRADGDFTVCRYAEGNTLFGDHFVLARAMKRAAADALWSTYYKALILCPCPAVITIHDVIPFVARTGALEVGAPGTAVRRTWMKLLAHRASRVVTDSVNSKQDLTSVLRVSDDKIAVIPVGLDIGASDSPATDAAIERARGRYRLPSSYLLYLGRFDPHKNVETLVEAWDLVPSALRARYPLVLAGGGGERFGGVGDHVHVAGFIDDEDLAAVYSAARAFAFPSCYEGFGLPPLEAMAHGIPVVCSNVASLPEVTGGAALLVDPTNVAAWADALERILTDEPLRKGAIDSGLERAGEFHPDRTAPLLAELLERTARRT